MKLLVITQYFWPENFRINDLVEEFVQRGHEVTVLTGKPNYPVGKIFPEYASAPQKFDSFAGARIVRVPLVPRGKGGLRLIWNYLSFALSASLLGNMKLKRERFDVIFVYEPSPITVGLPAALFRRTKSAPIAFWVLDLWPETLKAIGIVKSAALLGLVGKLVSFVYNNCDLILAQSKSFVPEIQKYARPGASIAYFPSWAESMFQPTVMPQAESSAKQQFDILFAGNIGDAQDFPAILNAAEMLKSRKDIRWLIVGDGRMAQWVRTEVERRGLSDNVHLLGRHPLEKMPEFYAAADALLVTLKNEPIFSMTIPGKLQSYLAAGRPILAMIDGEGADVVRRAEAGLCCRASDAAALAKAVQQMAAMPQKERERMGENGISFSKTEFDRNILMSRLEEWLMSLRKSSP
ncbi:glycosyltransferase family 4 protein [Herbaspirillum robiniae]|uniref:glycosyltransferase family 4 protein n=1 Tax=Herbaspirillum robiniae TaxID=2014887 RepID=UPI003D785E7D